jgi:two-component system cell cycle sensor histidine kinase/response regulator CckA
LGVPVYIDQLHGELRQLREENAMLKRSRDSARMRAPGGILPDDPSLAQQEAGNAVYASDDGFRALFGSNPQPMWVFDTSTLEFIEVNDAAISHYGYSREEFLAMTMLDIRPEDEREAFRVLAAGGYPPEQVDRDWFHQTRDGRRICVRAKGTGLSFAGRPARLLTIEDVTEQRQAQQAMLQSRALLQSTLDGLTAHIAVIDTDGVIVMVNAAWMEFGSRHGATAAAANVGANYLAACDEEALAGIRAVIAGDAPQFRLEYPCHDEREQRWFAMNATRFEGGGSPMVVLAHENITSLKRTEAALRESEQRLTLGLEATTQSLSEAQSIARLGHWDWDLVTGALWWSDENYRIFGFEPQEFPANYPAFLERVHPDDRQAVEDAVAGALQHGAYSIDHRILTTDGEERIIAGRGEVTFDAAGAPVRIIGTGQDVTESRHAAAALRQQKDLLSAVLSGAPILMFTTGCDGVITLSDGRALALLGLEPGEVVGRSAFDVFSDVSGAVENMRRALAGETVTFTSKIGALTFDTLYAPLNGANGSVDGVVGVAFDTSERERLQQELSQSQKMEGIGRLAGGIAHDFNNLLTAIISYSEFVADSLSPHDERRGDVAEVLKAARRASDLTRQLLAFARRQVVELKVVNLNDLVLDTDRLLRRLIGEDIELITLPGAALAQVKIDTGQFEQILVNLAVNARDAMPTGGKLTIQTESATLDDEFVRGHPGAAAGAYVTLSVRDNGSGMDEETLQRNFTIYLPATDEGGADPAEPATALPNMNGVETILLVEDELQLRRLTERALRERGYSVLTARNGSEALVRAQEFAGTIDLLLTDVVMPYMSGVQLAEQMVVLRPGIGVLYISGYPGGAPIQEPLGESGVEFLAKPFSSASLAAKVRSVLDALPAR